MSKSTHFTLQVLLAFLAGILLVFGINSLMKERRSRSRNWQQADADALSKDWHRVGDEITQAGRSYVSGARTA